MDTSKLGLFAAEKGRGETVVLVHGIPTDYRAWTPQVEALSEEYRVVTYSRRYAFPNTRDGDVMDSTIQNNAADLATLVGQLGAGPVHLVGHSYGGFIAAYLATTSPNLIRSLVLVEPAIGPLLLKNEKSAAESLALLLRSPSTALSARRFLTRYNGPSLKALERGDKMTAVRLNVEGVQDSDGAFDRLPEPVKAMMLDNSRTVREVATPFPILTRAELARIAVPTMLVTGHTSARWLRKIAEIAASSIPGSRLIQITGSGHYPHIEKPSEFNAALLGFLNDLEKLETPAEAKRNQ